MLRVNTRMRRWRNLPWQVAAGVLVLGVIATTGRADVASDQPAAILVFPKIVVDTSDPPNTARGRIDTLIRVSNTSDDPVFIKCFYVNANGHCSNSDTICDPYDRHATGQCSVGSICEAGWQESDFVLRLTPQQPIAWLASKGAAPCTQVTSGSGIPCFPDIGDGSLYLNRAQPVPEDPFIGELKCIAVDASEVPVSRNVLKGEVELERSNTGPDMVDVAAYNAIGIPAITGAGGTVEPNDGDNVLVLGGGVCIGGSRDQFPCAAVDDCPGGRCSAEYAGCPNLLILDHFFDGATDPISQKRITTRLTIVPCSEDFETQKPAVFAVQFLVFNEYEQRFSTSRRPISCFHELRLTDIDGSDQNLSIFSAAVAGTLTGQTRLRAVIGDDPRFGYTILGVAEEFREDGGTAAFNVHFHGTRPESDFIYLP